jgi:feruloyl-CoA synthase
VDDDDPDRGLLFDGRIAESFKLTTGAWVTAGTLQTKLLGIAAVLGDAVILRSRRRLCRGRLLGQPGGEEGAGTLRRRGARRRRPSCPPRRQLRAFNSGVGSAMRIERLLLLAEPPGLDAGEITDKGYINQRGCLERRASDVERLYATPLDPAVVSPRLSD